MVPDSSFAPDRATGTPASLRKRGARAGVGAVGVALAFWILRAGTGPLPAAIDHVYWPFTVIVSVVVFLWLLVR